MTSQTNSSVSLIPTSALTSSSSTSTGDSDSDTISDLFTSSGSPPLIVAFLAIGLFVVAMVGVFGWRRFSRARRRDDQLIIMPNRGHKPSPLGERPLLWDVWVDPKVSQNSSVEATRWENITPMTATLTFPIPPVQPPVDPPPIKPVPDPNDHTLFGMLRSFSTAVKRFYFPVPPPPPLPPPPPAEKEIVPPVSHTSDEIEWGDASSLRISAIITMPMQRYCNGNETDPERMELQEFCIGAMNVPCWSEGG